MNVPQETTRQRHVAPKLGIYKAATPRQEDKLRQYMRSGAFTPAEREQTLFWIATGQSAEAMDKALDKAQARLKTRDEKIKNSGLTMRQFRQQINAYAKVNLRKGGDTDDAREILVDKAESILKLDRGTLPKRHTEVAWETAYYWTAIEYSEVDRKLSIESRKAEQAAKIAEAKKLFERCMTVTEVASEDRPP